ncbi:MAG: hypothetical protein ACOXZV_10325 [Bacteroidales bacterium]|jgi:hypothetical protein
MRLSKLFIKYFIFPAVIMIALSGCIKKNEPPVYSQGTFPDTVLPLTNLNSEYDDYNTGIYLLQGYMPLVFSSNRASKGGQFDFVQGIIDFEFDQCSGQFNIATELTEDIFLATLVERVNTPRDELGPYRVYSSIDNNEYLIYSTCNEEGNLDLYYTKNQPYYSTGRPIIEGPFPVNILNTSADEAYFCFDTRLKNGYFSANNDGNFDIFMINRPDEYTVYSWLSSDYTAPVKLEGLNTVSDEKCPFIFNNVMVFVSDRPGGYGGFDIYYSIFKNGEWGTPVNLGPDINTEHDEYRPVIGGTEQYTNMFMIFSSDRDGGKGGFDLYFTGLNIPE